MTDTTKERPSAAGVETARAALSVAEREHADCQASVEKARREATAAADRYDASPDDVSGEAAIAARKAEELAQLRLDRAQKRLDAARAEIAREQRAHGLDLARFDLASARKDLATAKASEGRSAALVAPLLEPVGVEEAVRAFRAQRTEATEAHNAEVAKSTEAQRRLVFSLRALGAMLAGSDEGPILAGELADAEAQLHAAITSGASVAAFRAAIGPEVALLRIGASILRSAFAGIAAELDAVNARAAALTSSGVQTAPLDGAHAAAAALLALSAAAPDLLPLPWVAGSITGELFTDQGDHVRAAALGCPLAWLLTTWGTAEREGRPPRLSWGCRSASNAKEAARMIERALSHATPTAARLALEAAELAARPPTAPLPEPVPYDDSPDPGARWRADMMKGLN